MKKHEGYDYQRAMQGVGSGYFPNDFGGNRYAQPQQPSFGGAYSANTTYHPEVVSNYGFQDPTHSFGSFGPPATPASFGGYGHNGAFGAPYTAPAYGHQLVGYDQPHSHGQFGSPYQPAWHSSPLAQPSPMVGGHVVTPPQKRRYSEKIEPGQQEETPLAHQHKKVRLPQPQKLQSQGPLPQRPLPQRPQPQKRPNVESLRQQAVVNNNNERQEHYRRTGDRRPLDNGVSLPEPSRPPTSDPTENPAPSFNRFNVCPPLGMARDLKQSEHWSKEFDMVMNGLVPVPIEVVGTDNKPLPATNNGRRNPYTTTSSIYHEEWAGEGAHPTSARDKTVNCDRPPMSGSTNNKLPLPKNRYEVLRVLAIGPYYGFCLPTTDFNELKEYHRLEAGSAQQNWLTNVLKETVEAYYKKHLQHTHQPYYLAMWSDVLKKSQHPQGMKRVTLESGREIKVRSYDKRDKIFYEFWAANKGAAPRGRRATAGPSGGAKAAADAVKAMQKLGQLPIHAHPPDTNFSKVAKAISKGELAWRDWSDGHCLDDHWMWHEGNEGDRKLWDGRTSAWSPAQGRDVPMDPKLEEYERKKEDHRRYDCDVDLGEDDVRGTARDGDEEDCYLLKLINPNHVMAVKYKTKLETE